MRRFRQRKSRDSSLSAHFQMTIGLSQDHQPAFAAEPSHLKLRFRSSVLVRRCSPFWFCGFVEESRAKPDSSGL